MNHKTRIGITLRIVKAPNYDEKRNALSQDWVNLFEKVGILPVLIPNGISDIPEFLNHMKVEGLILSGGDNIGDDPLRDRTENQILQFATSSKLPVLGVCRGMQVINSYFGGKNTDSDSNHVAKPHEINIFPPISDLTQMTKTQVNSYHHNTILEKDLGKDIMPFATCPADNTIEGFFHKNFPFSGVMWHPEREQNQFNLTIVKKLLENLKK